MTKIRKTPIKLIRWYQVAPLPMDNPRPDEIGDVAWVRARDYLNDPYATLEVTAREYGVTVEGVRRSIWRVYYVLADDRTYFNQPKGY